MRSRVEIPDDVKEERRRISQAVEPVEDAAMSREDAAGVLDAEVALQRRYGDVAGEAGKSEEGADGEGGVGSDRRQPGSHHRREQRRRGNAAEDTGPGLAGADLGDDFRSADRLAPEILGDV